MMQQPCFPGKNPNFITYPSENVALCVCFLIGRKQWLGRFRGWTGELRKDVGEEREKENGLDRANGLAQTTGLLNIQ
jgi:hypothetical protein